MTGIIMRSICGFLLQILPCAFFCLYPFFDRFKIRRSIALVTAGTGILIMCAVFTLVGISVPAEPRFICQDIVFYLTLLFLLVIYIITIRATITQKLFVFFIVMNYGFLLMETQRFITYHLNYIFHEDGYLYPPGKLLLTALFNLLLFFPMFMVAKRIRHAMNISIDHKLWQVLTVIPGGFILIAVISRELPYTAMMPEEYSGFILTMAMLIFMVFALCWIFQIVENTCRDVEEHAQLTMMVENYRRVEDSTKKIKEMRHDIHHQLNALNAYLQAEDYDGAKEYLKKVSDIMSSLPVIDYTPHLLINAILAEYKEKAEHAGICIEYNVLVPEVLPMEDVDICRLLTNLLDNALEGCTGIKSDEKTIHLKIHRNGSFLFLSCENGCNGSALQYKNGKLISTKSDDGSHGLGISIMNDIAEKYNGIFRTEINGDHFMALANLCLFEH